MLRTWLRGLVTLLVLGVLELLVLADDNFLLEYFLKEENFLLSVYEGENQRPSGRYGACSTRVSETEIFFFGGIGYGEWSDDLDEAHQLEQFTLGDAWLFNNVEGEYHWTFLGGTTEIGRVGNTVVYGGNEDIVHVYSEDVSPYPRSAASCDYIGNDVVALYGGMIQVSKSHLETISNAVILFDLNRLLFNILKTSGTNPAQDGMWYDSEREYAMVNMIEKREGHSSFVYQDELVIFFGMGIDGRVYNSVWKLDFETKRWAIHSGNDIPNQYGQYGGNSTNFSPPGMSRAIGWQQADGIFYFFSGIGKRKPGSGLALLTDIWKYNITAEYGKEWNLSQGDGLYQGRSVIVENEYDPLNFPGGDCTSTHVPGYGFSFSQELGIICSEHSHFAKFWFVDKESFEWKVVKIEETEFSCPNYGERGVYSSTNRVGKHSGCNVEQFGNSVFVLFGMGYGENEAWPMLRFLNDGWEFTQNETSVVGRWIVGPKTLALYSTLGEDSSSFNEFNKPPGLRNHLVVSFNSSDGILIFGGDTFNTIRQNFVWQYSFLKDQWRIVYGNELSENSIDGFPLPNEYRVCSSEYAPSPRSWTKGDILSNEDVFLFGGFDVSSSTVGDVWSFSFSRSCFSLLSGRNGSYRGVYGETGVFSPGNVYPSRCVNCLTYMQESNRFVLFGGFGFSVFSDDSNALINDIWIFNPVTNEFKFVLGSNDGNSIQKVVSDDYDEGNVPPGLQFSSSWKNRDTMVIFGGSTMCKFYYNGCETSNLININDIWIFNSTVELFKPILWEEKHGDIGVLHSSVAIRIDDRFLLWGGLLTSNELYRGLYELTGLDQGSDLYWEELEYQTSAMFYDGMGYDSGVIFGGGSAFRVERDIIKVRNRFTCNGIFFDDESNLACDIGDCISSEECICRYGKSGDYCEVSAPESSWAPGWAVILVSTILFLVGFVVLCAAFIFYERKKIGRAIKSFKREYDGVKFEDGVMNVDVEL